jgi:hypothetical protein
MTRYCNDNTLWANSGKQRPSFPCGQCTQHATWPCCHFPCCDCCLCTSRARRSLAFASRDHMHANGRGHAWLQVRMLKVRASQDPAQDHHHAMCLSQIVRLVAMLPATSRYQSVGQLPSHPLYGCQTAADPDFPLEEPWLTPEFIAMLRSPLASPTVARALEPLRPVSCTTAVSRSGTTLSEFQTLFAAFKSLGNDRDSMPATDSPLAGEQAVNRHAQGLKLPMLPVAAVTSCSASGQSPLLRLFCSVLAAAPRTALDTPRALLKHLASKQPCSPVLTFMHAALLEAEGSLPSLREAVDVLLASRATEVHATSAPEAQPVHASVTSPTSRRVQGGSNVGHLAQESGTARITCMHAAFQLVKRRASIDMREGAELREYFVGHLSPAARAALLLDAWTFRDLLGVGPGAHDMLEWVAAGRKEGASLAEAAPAVTCVLRHLMDLGDLSEVGRWVPSTTSPCALCCLRMECMPRDVRVCGIPMPAHSCPCFNWLCCATIILWDTVVEAQQRRPHSDHHCLETQVRCNGWPCSAKLCKQYVSTT